MTDELSVETKICNRCLEKFPMTSDFFNIRIDSKDGFRNQCKKCTTKKNASYYQDNKDGLVDYARTYREENIVAININRKIYRLNNKELLSLRDKKYYSGHQEYVKSRVKRYVASNKETISIKKSIYRIKNKEQCNISNMNYRSNKSKLPSTFTIEQWENTKLAFDNKCAYCGMELPLAKEHFLPVSNGGEFTHNNIIPSCRSCNSSKFTNSPFIWYPKQSFYTKGRESKILNFLNYNESHTQQLMLF